jgi:hypothetical protein
MLVNITEGSSERYILVIAIRNIGNDIIKVEGILVKGKICNLSESIVIEQGITKC